MDNRLSYSSVEPLSFCYSIYSTVGISLKSADDLLLLRARVIAKFQYMPEPQRNANKSGTSIKTFRSSDGHSVAEHSCQTCADERSTLTKNASCKMCHLIHEITSKRFLVLKVNVFR